MNEEVNFCSQCGATVSPGVKFCSNCGHDLTNSSTQTPLDKAIKVEVTNATIEKGFKAVGKGFGAVGKVFKRKEKQEEKQEEIESQKRQFTDKQAEAILERRNKQNRIVNVLTLIAITPFLVIILFWLIGSSL